MPRCGATLNENNVTPWIRGDVKGVLGHEPTHPGAALPPLTEEIFKGKQPTCYLLQYIVAQPSLYFRPCLVGSHQHTRTSSIFEIDGNCSVGQATPCRLPLQSGSRLRK
jgi:hypothetical protein